MRKFLWVCRKYLPVLLVIAGIGLMILGSRLGEVIVFYRKAVMICLECIGVG